MESEQHRVEINNPDDTGRLKRFLIYFTWTIVALAFLFLEVRIEEAFRVYAQTSFNLRPGIIFVTLFPEFMGMLLRLPYLIKEVCEKRKWAVDWVKLCAVGIPFLYVVLNPIFLVFNVKFLIIQRFAHTITTSSMVMDIAGVVLGFIILGSLKEKVIETNRQSQSFPLRRRALFFYLFLNVTIPI